MDRKYKLKNKLNNKTNQNKLDSWKKYYYKNKKYHQNRCKQYHIKRMILWYNWLYDLGLTICEKCGFDKHPRVIDYHHLNPKDKNFDIGKFINGRQFNDENKELIIKELSKCQVLCPNCHRLIHILDYEQQNSIVFNTDKEVF